MDLIVFWTAERPRGLFLMLSNPENMGKVWVQSVNGKLWISKFESNRSTGKCGYKSLDPIGQRENMDFKVWIESVNGKMWLSKFGPNRSTGKCVFQSLDPI
ncbi:hypothetical protein AVEN_131409-1, partial [Araneus ventricosus]